MARDIELDRLKMQQTYAYQQNQTAWLAQDEAWERLQAAHKVMDRAYYAK